jgi:hypothetical protein
MVRKKYMELVIKNRNNSELIELLLELLADDSLYREEKFLKGEKVGRRNLVAKLINDIETAKEIGGK